MYLRVCSAQPCANFLSNHREIKVVYDHTRIASYRHLRVGNVGSEYGYWLFEGNECYSAGGFPSNPILSGSAPNRVYRECAESI